MLPLFRNLQYKSLWQPKKCTIISLKINFPGVKNKRNLRPENLKEVASEFIKTKWEFGTIKRNTIEQRFLVHLSSWKSHWLKSSLYLIASDKENWNKFISKYSNYNTILYVEFIFSFHSVKINSLEPSKSKIVFS